MWGHSLPKGWEERAKGTPKYRTPRLGNRVVQYVHSCLGVRSPKRSYVQLARFFFPPTTSKTKGVRSLRSIL